MPCLKWRNMRAKTLLECIRLAICFNWENKQAKQSKPTHTSSKPPIPRPPRSSTQIWIITWKGSSIKEIWVYLLMILRNINLLICDSPTEWISTKKHQVITTRSYFHNSLKNHNNFRGKKNRISDLWDVLIFQPRQWLYLFVIKMWEQQPFLKDYDPSLN